MIIDNMIIDRVFQPVINLTQWYPQTVSNSLAVGAGVLGAFGFVLNVIDQQMNGPMHVVALANIFMLSFSIGGFAAAAMFSRRQMRPGFHNPLRYVCRWSRPITASILLVLISLNPIYFGGALINFSFTLAGFLSICASYFQSCDLPPPRPQLSKWLQIV